jgi:hypothetical protein
MSVVRCLRINRRGYYLTIASLVLLAAGCSESRVLYQCSSSVRIETELLSDRVNWAAIPEDEYDSTEVTACTVWLGDKGVHLVGYVPDMHWLHLYTQGYSDPVRGTSAVCLSWWLHRYLALVRNKDGFALALYLSDQGVNDEHGPQPEAVLQDFWSRARGSGFVEIDPKKTYVEPGFYRRAQGFGVRFPPDYVPAPEDGIECH